MKNAGLQYVDEFTFSREQGFTGSAGASPVKGYMRGGHVKNPDKTKGKGKSRKGMPATVKAKGGSVHDKLMAEGGKMGYMKGGNNDELYKEGGKMGYAYGGEVKGGNTSPEFVQKRGKQDTMDDGVQPARRGRNQEEIEAGGTPRLRPEYMKGGKVMKARGGMTESEQAAYEKMAKGGKPKYGVPTKPSKTKRGKPTRRSKARAEDLGTGAAARAAKKLEQRSRKQTGALEEAVKAQRLATGTTRAMKGGYQHVGGPNPSKEYPASKAHRGMPKNVKMAGGRVGKRVAAR